MPYTWHDIFSSRIQAMRSRFAIILLASICFLLHSGEIRGAFISPPGMLTGQEGLSGALRATIWILLQDVSRRFRAIWKTCRRADNGTLTMASDISFPTYTMSSKDLPGKMRALVTSLDIFCAQVRPGSS